MGILINKNSAFSQGGGGGGGGVFSKRWAYLQKEEAYNWGGGGYSQNKIFVYKYSQTCIKWHRIK